MTEPTTRRGRRGDGTIYRTADGRLRASVTVPDAVTGEPRRVYLSGRTDAEVRRKLRQARAEAGAVGGTPTIAQWCERWLRLVAPRVRPATLALYRSNVRRHIVPALGDRELGQLRPSDVEAMTGAMIAAGSAPSTAALARRVLVIALTDAQRDGLVVRNVAQLARPPRTAEPRRRALTPDEVHQFLTAIEGDALAPLVALAVATGLRRGELLALRWSDVSDDTLTVSRAYARTSRGGYAVAEPKSRKARRSLALTALAVRALVARSGPARTQTAGRPGRPGRIATGWSSPTRWADRGIPKP